MDTPAGSDPSAPSAEMDGVVRIDAVCLGCGYGLTGLRMDGRCPECGRAVASSLRGNMLEYADGAYLDTLRRGLALVIAGTVLAAAWWVATPIALAAVAGTQAMTHEGALVFVLGLDLFGSALLLAGWWLATAPDPAMRDPSIDKRSRRVLRILLATIAAISALGFVAALTPGLSSTGLVTISGNVQLGPSTQWTPLVVIGLVLRVTLLVARVARFFVGLLYLTSLAERIPSRPLLLTTRRMAWAIPVMATFGIVLCGLGPVIAWAMYLSLLIRYRGAMTAVRGRMAD